MNMRKRLCVVLLALCLLPLLVLAEESAGETGALPIALEMHEVTGERAAPAAGGPESARESYVRYPEFTTTDESLAPALEKVNQAILDKARIPEYLQLLSTLTMGGTGLRMDCQVALCATAGNGTYSIEDRYASILFSAEGKMLSGRPSQVYYPMTFDLLTGDEVTFDQLFADPEGAKAYIEDYLTEEIEPELSTYLENSQIFPVPFHRFILDSFGHVILYWENSQLSFLSGYSGAVSFRRSQLAPWLDLTADGIISHMAYDRYVLSQPAEKQAENLWMLLRDGKLILADPSVSTGMSMVLLTDAGIHFTTDSGYYPGGAYWEAEEPCFRGTLLLADESEERVIGFLSSQADLFDIHTGETSLQEAIAFLGKQPDAQIRMDEASAELYCVCPGTAALYHLEPWMDGPGHDFTLYADADGIVQYVKLAFDE